MANVAGAKILLIVGGGIAAYKTLELIRRLKDGGASIDVILTEAGKQFVTALSLAALSGSPVREALFSLTDEARMGHIELSRANDLVVVAPATADLIARMAAGLANDLATTALVATDKRILIAPAMNVRMWLAPATQRNVATLERDGVLFVGPNTGPMADGEYGPGRLSEPPEILGAIAAALAPAEQSLAGKHVVVTSGPTVEPIDPVRFLSNRSSGRQGHAIAEAARVAGARVTLISGPVALPPPDGVDVVKVGTAEEMLRAAEAALPADIFVAAAAVADWRVEKQADAKLKKSAGGPPTLTLTENPDILRTIATRKLLRPKFVVGFAAETEDAVANAQNKLVSKGADLIVANSVALGTTTFGGEDNEVALITQGKVQMWPRMSKKDLAKKLIVLCAELSGKAI